jgi:hypothetical protein
MGRPVLWSNVNRMMAEPPRMPPGTQRLLADRLLDRLTGPDACRWALAALEAGFDTRPLRILAGMSVDPLPSFFEVRPYLEAALEELNVPASSSREDVLRGYARDLAEEILTGATAIQPALEEMHRSVVSPLNHANDLMGWCFLWEGSAPDGSFAELTGEDLERAAREFAAQWLEGRSARRLDSSCGGPDAPGRSS